MAATPAEKEFTQARIRVNEEGANVLADALEHYESHLTEVRRMLMDEGLSETIAILNRKLGQVRRILDEVSRTMEEQNW